MNKRFTSVELLIALAVIEILSMVVMLNLTESQTTTNFDTVARKLAADLSQIQQNDVSGNTNY
ncbi:MAG: hypothetical protein WCV63_09285 [Negativicutes bacterium]|jgi:Tfp pilus assembly protein FimT